jgi:hypothetical protein
MARQRFAIRRRADARGMAPSAAGWMPGPYPYAFGHAAGYGAVPRISVLEREGWQRVGAVPGVRNVWVMKRASAD